MKRNVVLETLVGKSKGVWFWTSNSGNNTRSATGELWYKEIAFTDSDEKAIRMCMTHRIEPEE